MASVGSNNDVKIVVQFDRTSGYDTQYGDWTDTRRFYITKGLVPQATNGTSIGEANMGNPQTLIDFAQWGMTNYPADHYALIIWNHGGGWRSLTNNGAFKEVASDDTDNDVLYATELRSALQTITNNGTLPLDMLGFDACLMGMIEVDAQIMPYAAVRVGSEKTEPGEGWPYDTILTNLVNNPAMSSSQLGTVIVDRYYASYANGQTQSAVNLGTPYNNLKSAVNELASVLMSRGLPYKTAILTARRNTQLFDNRPHLDLYDLAYQLQQKVPDQTIKDKAAAVMQAVNATVINNKSGANWPGAHGISIYFPETQSDYDTTYGSPNYLQFAMDTQWDEWLTTFHNAVRSDEVLLMMGDGQGAPASSDNPVLVSVGSSNTPVAAAELWLTYDSTTGLTLASVNPTTQTTGFNATFTLDQTTPAETKAHLLIYSLSGQTIPSSGGSIMEVRFNVNQTAQVGITVPLRLLNADLADAVGNAIPNNHADTGIFTIISPYKPGDINGDNSINVFDLQRLINMIMHNPKPDTAFAPSEQWQRADLNGDGQWNIFDLQRLINLIMGQAVQATSLTTEASANLLSLVPTTHGLTINLQNPGQRGEWGTVDSHA